MRPRDRRRGGLLEQLGALPASAMLAFGIAGVLILASIGLIVFSLNARLNARQARPATTATATALVASAPTPSPTPTAFTEPTSTPRTTPTPTTRATATVRRATPAVAATPAPLGAGQSTAVRAIVGSMLLATGGGPTLPPPPSAGPAATAPAPGAAPPVNPPPVATYVPPPAANPPYNPPPYVPPSNPPPYVPPANPSPYVPPVNPPPSNPPPTNPTPVPPTAPPNTPAVGTPANMPDVSVTPTAPAPTATPTVVLPPVALPVSGLGDYRYAFTYTLATDLKAPPSADAYRVTWHPYTQAEVAQLARTLGLTGGVEVTGDGFRVTGNGALVVSNNLLVYTPVLRMGTPVPAQGVSNQAAIDIARTWLTDRGLLPADAHTTRISRPIPTRILVSFHPNAPQSVILGDPRVLVTLDLGGNVLEVSSRWLSGATPLGPVALRNPSDAWADVQAGKGYTEVDWTVPARYPQGTTFSGPARVTQISLAWVATTNGQGETFLAPIYVFTGEVTIAEENTSVYFRTYVPATKP